MISGCAVSEPRREKVGNATLRKRGRAFNQSSDGLEAILGFQNFTLRHHESHDKEGNAEKLRRLFHRRPTLTTLTI